MTHDVRRSAVLIRVPLPPPLERLRRRAWPLALAGVPGHVTILYPFLDATALDDAIRARLVGIARSAPPFEVTFDRVERFPSSVYLAPDPAHPFRRLTIAVQAAWPDHPPYGGEYDTVVPHLTLAEGHAANDALAHAAARWLPFTVRVRTLEVIEEGETGRWRTRWRVPLGADVVRR